MPKKTLCCIFSYDITKGMKSYGSIGLLKSNNKTKELLYYSIKLGQKAFRCKNLYTILGFESEKLKKKIDSYKFHTETIINHQYKESNHGYAFKLFLEHISNIDLTDISGVVFFPGNLLIHKLPRLNYKHSWIAVKKKHKKNINNDIGCTVNSNIINYMFYDIGDYLWTDILFLTSKDIKKISSNIDMYYNNMFMFEVINTMIEKQKIQISTIVLDKIGDVVKINGIKDKSKIKTQDMIK